VKPRDIFTQHMAKYTSPTKGKDGTSHFGDLKVRHIVSPISMLGDLIPVMTGVAMAGRYLGQNIVALTWIGDGGSSTGAFHEGLGLAAAQKAPFVLIVENNQWAYSTPVSRQVPVKNLAYLIDSATYTKEVTSNPGIWYGWHGAISGGITLIEATQTGQNYNAAVNLIRLVPGADFLPPRTRSTINVLETYGKIDQPFIPTTPPTLASVTKTNIFHADAEHDKYFTPRFYGLVGVSFDHNFSQGLNLQQIYGGGVGYTIIKDPKQTLDLKALIQYEKQSFIDPLPGENQNLIGSTFSANYLRKLPKGMLFNQQVAYIPAWNNLHAYSFTELNTFSIPAYKRLSLTLGTLDSYLNNPATALPPVKRNSFQFTAGVTYAFK